MNRPTGENDALFWEQRTAEWASRRGLGVKIAARRLGRQNIGFVSAEDLAVDVALRFIEQLRCGAVAVADQEDLELQLQSLLRTAAKDFFKKRKRRLRPLTQVEWAAFEGTKHSEGRDDRERATTKPGQDPADELDVANDVLDALENDEIRCRLVDDARNDGASGKLQSIEHVAIALNLLTLFIDDVPAPNSQTYVAPLRGIREDEWFSVWLVRPDLFPGSAEGRTAAVRQEKRRAIGRARERLERAKTVRRSSGE